MIFLSLAAALFLPSIDAPAMSDYVFSPKKGQKFQPLEVTFKLKANFENPYDSKQIDAQFLVTGPEDLSAEQPAFYYQEFKLLTAASGVQALAPDGGPVWKMRFAPWKEGVYSLFPSATDATGRFEGKKIDVRADDSTEMPFIAIKDKQQYFQKGKDAFFPVIADLERSEKHLYDFSGEIESVKKSGANTIRVNLGAQFKLEPKLGQFDQREFWALDRLFESARSEGINILLVLDDGIWLTSKWSQNPYNAKQGGPCQTQKDFWENLKARIRYKQRLRYLVSRITAYNNLMGVQFFSGVPAPDYWVLEMSGEFLAHHTYGVPLSTLPGTKAVWDQKWINFSSIAVEPADTPSQMCDRIANAVSETRRQTDKPILVGLTSAPKSDLVALCAQWTPLVCSAAGTELSGAHGADSSGALAGAIMSIQWLKSKWSVQRLSLEKSLFAQALVGSDSGILLVAKSQGGGASRFEVAVSREKKYQVEWFDIGTGKSVSTLSIESQKRKLNLAAPDKGTAEICIFR